MTIRRLAGALALSASIPALAVGGVVVGKVPPGAGAIVTRNGTQLATSAYSVSNSGVVSLVGSTLVRGDAISVSAVSPAASGNIPAPAIKGILAEGDSITYGYLSSNNSTKSYPAVLSGLTGLPFTNQGEVGDKLVTMDSNYAANDAPSYNATNRNLFIILAGINDISGGATLGQLQTALQSICAKARQTGFIVAVATVLPSNYSGTTSAQITLRQNYNTWMLANYTSFADYMIDFAADSRLSDPTNATYFNSDMLHLTDAGYAAMADVARSKLALPYAAPATAYTLTGSATPTAGTSSTYTLTANGPLSNDAAITVVASPDGALSATSVVLRSGPSPTATFTYTPASAGTKTISVTNSVGLTNPSALTLTATAAALTGPVYNTTAPLGAPSFSNNNMSATFNGTGDSVALVSGVVTGKRLLAASMDTVSAASGFVGIGVASGSMTNGLGFGSTNGEAGFGYYNNGSSWKSGGQVTSPPSFTTGDKVGIVIDQTNALAWVTKDGVNFYGSSSTVRSAADVAAGTGGVSISATKALGNIYAATGAAGGKAGSVATLITWPSGWSVPSGFSSL